MGYVYKLFPVFFLFFVSCDALVAYEFNIQNKTQEPLTVMYEVFGKDTMLLVPADSTALLFLYKTVGDRRDIYKKGMHFFGYIRLDTLSTVADTFYLQRKLWTMEWKNGTHVVYTLPIE